MRKLLTVLLSLMMVVAMMPVMTGVAFATVDTSDCFYFDVEDTSVTVKLLLGTGGPTGAVPSLQYSIDGGEWAEFKNENGVVVSGGKKLYLKANAGSEFNQVYKCEDGNYGYYAFQLVGTANVSIGGNIMSLIGSDMKDNSFYYVFENESQLMSADSLVLPNETKPYCYCGMFADCNALSQAPTLPAETLTEGCYQDMFNGCTSLVQAPELNATNLAKSCYRGMFSRCSALKQAPELKADKLTDYCYTNMFDGCSELNSVTMLATDVSATYCLYDWLNDVAETGTFVKASSMDADKLYIPEGWTVEDKDDSSINWSKLAKGVAITAGITAATVGTIHTVKAIKDYKAEKVAEEPVKEEPTVQEEPTPTEPETPALTTAEVKEAVDGLAIRCNTNKTSSGTEVYATVTDGDLEALEAAGYTVTYKFYRSKYAKKSYKLMETTTNASYTDTIGIDGKMYYYKAKVVVTDKDGNEVAVSAIKNCKYGNRKF